MHHIVLSTDSEERDGCFPLSRWSHSLLGVGLLLSTLNFNSSLYSLCSLNSCHWTHLPVPLPSNISVFVLLPPFCASYYTFPTSSIYCLKYSNLNTHIMMLNPTTIYIYIYIYIQGALKFPLQTSRTCRGDWFDNILNWNPCPETYRFRATAIWKQALPERTPRVSTSNSFAMHPPAELHDEGCLGRIMWCQFTFILPGAGSSLIHVPFSVTATWLSTLLLNTPTWSFCMAKLEVMEELLLAFINIVSLTVRLHCIPFSP